MCTYRLLAPSVMASQVCIQRHTCMCVRICTFSRSLSPCNASRFIDCKTIFISARHYMYTYVYVYINTQCVFKDTCVYSKTHGCVCYVCTHMQTLSHTNLSRCNTPLCNDCKTILISAEALHIHTVYTNLKTHVCMYVRICTSSRSLLRCNASRFIDCKTIFKK
jgi:hypothetical protein